jgi:hypothetical protein
MAAKLSKIKILVMFVLLVSGLLAVDISHPSGVALAAAATSDSCIPPGTTYGTDTMSVTINASDTLTYNIWTRLQTPDASTTNSILLNIDGAHCYNVGGSTSMASNTWDWVDYSGGVTADPIQVSLTPGAHTFTLTGTESGMEVDLIEALSDPTCTPSGTGTNCIDSANAPATVAITSPTTSSTVSGTTTVTADASGASSVQFKIDNVNVGSPHTQNPYTSQTPYTYSWDTTSATDGTHTITAVATDPSNNTVSSSVSVTVDNSSGTSPPPLVGDLDGDGHVTGHDLSIFLGHYGTNYAPAEFDGGTIVEGHDLSMLLSNYGK